LRAKLSQTKGDGIAAEAEAEDAAAYGSGPRLHRLVTDLVHGAHVVSPLGFRPLSRNRAAMASFRRPRARGYMAVATLAAALSDNRLIAY
jgi:hypothetical protein